MMAGEAGWRVTTGGEDKEPGSCGGSEGHRRCSRDPRVQGVLIRSIKRRSSSRRDAAVSAHKAELVRPFSGAASRRPRAGWLWLGLLVLSEP